MNTKKEGGKEMALRYLNDVGEKFVRTDRKEMVQGITKACGRVVVESDRRGVQCRIIEGLWLRYGFDQPL